MQSSTKSKIAIGLSSAALMAGAMQYAEPPKNESQQRQQSIERGVNDLSDSHGRDADRHRDDGDTLLNGTIKDRNTPGEHRPSQPHVRLRVVP